MTTPKNPLLDRNNRMPGQSIRLPSLGKFYTNGELSEDTINGEIVLFPMTMTDEIMMKSPDMLFQGTAIDIVFKRCSPNIVKPLNLLTSDVDYILTHLRRISFGSTIDIEFTCSKKECGKKNEVAVPLDYFTSESKELDADTYQEKYKVVTPNSGNTVRIKPVTFNDYLLIQQVNADTLNDPDAMKHFILDSFISVIDAVDEVKNDSAENRGFIKEWLDSVHRADSQAIIDAIENVQDFGPKFKYTTKCSCGHKNELTTEINPTAFFMQPSSPKTKN